MGVDLTIAFDDKRDSSIVLAYDRLGFHMRKYDLWDLLNNASTPTSRSIMWYGDDGVETTKTNHYGDPVQQITVGEFLKICDQYGTDNWSAWDKAIIAMLRVLPADDVLYLWFH